MKLPFLGNLKFLKVKKEPLPYVFRQLLIEAKLQQIKSREEAAMLRKSFKAGFGTICAHTYWNSGVLDSKFSVRRS
jgi:hypothetical protein